MSKAGYKPAQNRICLYENINHEPSNICCIFKIIFSVFYLDFQWFLFQSKYEKKSIFVCDLNQMRNFYLIIDQVTLFVGFFFLLSFIIENLILNHFTFV